MRTAASSAAASRSAASTIASPPAAAAREVGAEAVDVPGDVHAHHYDIRVMSCQHHVTYARRVTADAQRPAANVSRPERAFSSVG